jgi:hypothetical protein
MRITAKAVRNSAFALLLLAWLATSHVTLNAAFDSCTTGQTTNEIYFSGCPGTCAADFYGNCQAFCGCIDRIWETYCGDSNYDGYYGSRFCNPYRSC